MVWADDRLGLQPQHGQLLGERVVAVAVQRGADRAAGLRVMPSGNVLTLQGNGWLPFRLQVRVGLRACLFGRSARMPDNLVHHATDFM